MDPISEKVYEKQENMAQNTEKKCNKSIDFSNSINYNSIPMFNNEIMNISLLKTKFQNEALIKEHNIEMTIIKEQKRKISYCKKVIADNSFFKTKNSKQKNKNDFSAIKFILNIKNIISNIIRKNNFYYIIGFLKIKSLIQNLMDIFQKKRNNLIKDVIEKIRLRSLVLKILEITKKDELKHKIRNLKVCKIKALNLKPSKKNILYNEKFIESNVLFILGDNKKNKYNLKSKINIFEDNKLIIDKNI